VRHLGFDTVRVRHFGHRATVEVDPGDVARLQTPPGLGAVLASLRSLGWSEVEVDPRGYRPGSMNETLTLWPVPRAPIGGSRSSTAAG
jgi:pyridinium-3,5-biscarboxylic acid mononucleotide sulfurtransferase